MLIARKSLNANPLEGFESGICKSRNRSQIPTYGLKTLKTKSKTDRPIKNTELVAILNDALCINALRKEIYLVVSMIESALPFGKLSGLDTLSYLYSDDVDLP